MKLNLKRQLAFFLITYMSPFVALYAWVLLGITHYTFTTLLLGALGIWGVYAGALFAYRLVQPYVQQFRTTRAIRKTLNPSKPSM